MISLAVIFNAVMWLSLIILSDAPQIDVEVLYTVISVLFWFGAKLCHSEMRQETQLPQRNSGRLSAFRCSLVNIHNRIYNLPEIPRDLSTGSV